jgi:hypothetical protein
MAIPYSFTRRTDGPGNPVFAAHMNEVQQAIEELAAKIGPSFVAGNRYGADTVVPGGGFTTDAGAAIVANRLYAVPFWTGPAGCMFTNLNINITVAAAGNVRMGIYDSLTTPPFYPGALLLDASTLAHTGTGVKTSDITDTLYTGSYPSRLLWLAAVFSTVPTVRQWNQSSPIVPLDSGGSVQGGIYMDHTFGALPATFDNPPDGTLLGVPHIWTVAG